MSEQVDQCPFLNRSDPRCGRHFRLENLQNAFRYCFGTFETCPQYAQLLIERRARRGGMRGEAASAAVGEEALNEWSTPQRVVVEVTVGGRNAKPVVSAA
jgi:hypothetical protein